MPTEPLRELVTRLATSVSALAALGAALDARANQTPLPATSRGPMNDVLEALGVGDSLDGIADSELR
jgi:hypothetical protein